MTTCRSVRVALVLTALFAAAPTAVRAQSDQFVWVDKYEDDSPVAPGGEYTIGPGDLLGVQVWDQDKMSARTRVRTDGRISLPFLNDVVAAGKGPVQLATEIQEGLKAIILTPRVTVTVEETQPLNISILGEVAKPGLHTLEVGAGVAQALASAGGLSQYAKKDRIFVLRPGPKQARIRFTYEAVTRNQGRAPLFRLRSGDVLVVE